LKQTTPSLVAPALTQKSAASLECNALYQLGVQDLELLSKFQTRTVLSISIGKSLRVYQNEMIKLAFSVSFGS